MKIKFHREQIFRPVCTVGQKVFILFYQSTILKNNITEITSKVSMPNFIVGKLEGRKKSDNMARLRIFGEIYIRLYGVEAFN